MTAQFAFGAQADLACQITTHLFIISPNNSGSTFVRRAIETCAAVWSLPREGQHMLGYTGPNLEQEGQELIWASDPDRLAALRDPRLYDWDKTRKAWYFQAHAHNEQAQVFMTKSPPFLPIVDQLRGAFHNPKFLFLVRNPYAVVEAICRYRERHTTDRRQALDSACAHILNCFELLQESTKRHADIACFLRYEDMCAEPLGVAQNVVALVPELHDLNFDQKLSVKGNYDEPLRNMNADQIARLSASDVTHINRHFAPKADLLSQFGYDLLG